MECTDYIKWIDISNAEMSGDEEDMSNSLHIVLGYPKRYQSRCQPSYTPVLLLIARFKFSYRRIF